MASERIDIIIATAGAQEAARLINAVADRTEQLNHTQKQSQQNTQSWGNTFRSVSTVVNAFIGLQIVQFIGRIGAAMIEGAARIEMYRANFETMLGSAEAAGVMLENIREMAARTPFETEDLVGATQTLMAFGVQAENIQGTLQMLGDIALGDSERLRSLSLAFGQVSSAGRLTGQDLLQMVNVGFNPLQELVRTQGRDIGYWRREMEQGRVTAQMVGDALRSATEEGGRFHDGMDKGSKTLIGQWSTLKDNIMNVGIAIAELALYNDDLLSGLNRVFDALSGSQEYWGEFVNGMEAASNSLLSRLIPSMTEFISIYETVSSLVGSVQATQAELEDVNAGHLANLANRRRPGGGTPGGGTPGGGTPGGGGNQFAGIDSWWNQVIAQQEAISAEAAKDSAARNATATNRIFSLFDPDASVAELELYNQHVNGIVDITKNMASGITGIMDQISTNEKMRLTNDYNSKKAFINANVKDEAEKKKQLAALDEWYAAEQAKQAKEQAKRQKAMMLMNAIVNTATGITSALAMSGPPWVGIAMAAIVGAMGAAQIALISQQPIPEAAEGALIRGSASGSIIRAGEEGRSEMIVPFENDDAMDKLGGFGARTTVNLNIENLYASEEIPQKLAQEIDKALYKLYRNRNSMFGSAMNG